MENKLKLEHLSAYLPYGLMFLPIHYNPEGKTDKLYELSTIYDSDEFAVNGYTSDYIKPILKPLSDIDNDEENTPEELARCCWHYTQSLISEHYDVFGLIDEGLAVDVNTLTNKTI